VCRGRHKFQRCALTIGEYMHPADEIGKALSQARSILSSLVNCYDRPETRFATGQVFIAEAIIAAEEILGKADNHLAALYADYGNSAHQDEEAEAQNSEIEAVAKPTEDALPENYLPSSFGLFGRHPSVSHLANKLDSIVETLPPAPAPMRPEEMVEQPAQSYEELLEKLTAMADSAAYHTGHGDNGLLPVLESLRDDMLRMRSVA
jgi:hypothetical protein